MTTNSSTIFIAALSLPDSTTSLNLGGRLELHSPFSTPANINLAGALTTNSFYTAGKIFASQLAFQGTVNIGARGELMATVGPILNTGTLNFLSPVNPPTGQFGYFTHVDSPLVNQGSIHVYGNQLNIEINQLSNESSMQIDAGALVIGGKVTNELNGFLSGGGSLNTVDNHGLISPGDDHSGILTMRGAFHQFSDGALLIDISGRIVGAEYDQLALKGSPDGIDGDLQIAFHAGFEPNHTDSFTILTGPYNGRFRNTDGDKLNTPQGTFDVVYGNGVIVLTGFAAVPEPGSFVLAALGLIGLFAGAQRRRLVSTE